MRPVVLFAAAGLLAGCAGTTVAERPGSPSRVPSAVPTIPRPVQTIVENAHIVAAGQSVDVAAQRGVGLRLAVSKPSYSRTSLSSSYGYAPQHGWYVTFRLTATNTGRRTITIDPTQFVLRVPGQGTVTSYDGNAPYSGAHAQLRTTALEPGQRLSDPLTYDVAGKHGQLRFVPDRSAAAVWTF